MIAEEYRESRPSPDNRRAEFCLKVNSKFLQRSFVARQNARRSCDMFKPREQPLEMLSIICEKHFRARLQDGDRFGVEKQRIEQDIIGEREISLCSLHLIKGVVPGSART